MRALDHREIGNARNGIDRVFLSTPLRNSTALNMRFAAELVFKDETENPIKSFKGRGTCNFVNRLSIKTDLVCASAGNFGQGLAWAGRRRGYRVTVFAPRSAPRCKVEAIRQFGGELYCEAADLDAAKDCARAFAQETDALFVEDGADPLIAEGAGTIAAELTENTPPFNAIVVPLGNGALASGVGAWMKHASPSTQVIAVSAAGAPAMARSVRQGRIITTKSTHTIADGIAVRVPVPYALRTLRTFVDDVVLVEDSTIVQAMEMLYETLGRVVEPAGAAGLAALISQPQRWKGKRVAIPLCGGNIDPPLFQKLVEGRL